jgi:NADH-quinone oxidoreductase subunit L
VTFFGEFRGTADQKHHLHESPLVMTVPLMILAVLSVVGGFLNIPHFFHLDHMAHPGWLTHWFAPVIPVMEMHMSEATEWTLMLFTTGLALVVIAVSYFIYLKRENLPVADAEQGGFTRLLANKFYVDEIYDALFVRPVEKLSRMFHYYVDIQGVDGLVNGIGSGVQRLGGFFRKLQNGNIEYYLMGMVAGIVMLLLSLFM